MKIIATHEEKKAFENLVETYAIQIHTVINVLDIDDAGKDDNISTMMAQVKDAIHKENSDIHLDAKGVLHISEEEVLNLVKTAELSAKLVGKLAVLLGPGIKQAIPIVKQYIEDIEEI